MSLSIKLRMARAVSCSTASTRLMADFDDSCPIDMVTFSAPISTVDQRLAAIAGLHFFGIVQYIGNDRTDDWTEFYSALFGFTALPAEECFGILPKGRILRSPCTSIHLLWIEPEPGVLDVEDDECLQRMDVGTPDVPATMAQLRLRGVEFVASKGASLDIRGALTCTVMGGVLFELVHDELTLKLHQMGYRGDYSFEVFNDEYQAMPLETVAQRARKSTLWLGEGVLRRSVPLPNQIRLRR